MRIYTILLVLGLTCFCAGTCYATTFQVIAVRAKLFPTRADRGCWDMCTPWQQRSLFALSRRLRTQKGKRVWEASMASSAAALQLQGSKMPDPYVTLRFRNGQTLRSQVRSNTSTPDWGDTVQVNLKRGAMLVASVWDHDAISRDDKIGTSGIRAIPARILKTGGTWRLRFGQVHELILLFVKTSPPPTAPLFAPGRYRITVYSARLAPLKRTGQPWDIWKGKPDPFLVLTLGQHRLTTPTEMNTTKPLWHVSKELYLNGTESVSYAIWDRDIRSHDLMARCQFRTVAMMPFRAKGQLLLRCQMALQVRLSIRKVK